MYFLKSVVFHPSLVCLPISPHHLQKSKQKKTKRNTPPSSLNISTASKCVQMVRLDRFCYREERGSGVLCNGVAAQRNSHGSRIAACVLPSSPVPGNCMVTQHNRVCVCVGGGGLGALHKLCTSLNCEMCQKYLFN